MKKMIAMFALALSAWSVAGCAVGVEDVEENQALDEGAASTKSELSTPAATLSCPKPGTCNKASQMCLEPSNPDPSWCDILTACVNCGWEG